MYRILAIGAHDDECEYDVGGVSTLLADMGDDFILRQLLDDKFKWYGTGMYPAMGSDYF